MRFIRSISDITKKRKASSGLAKRLNRAIERKYPGAEVLLPLALQLAR